MAAKWKIKRSWQGGADGFFAWCEDIKPCIMNEYSLYEEYKPLDWQREAVEGLLAMDGERFVHDIGLLITPRQHGKTNLMALINLWIATTKPNQMIYVLGNTQKHVDAVQMTVLKGIIRNTPKLYALIPERSILNERIYIKDLGGMFVSGAANEAGSFGFSPNVLWVGDFHNITDLSAFTALKNGMIARKGFLLLDSNPDPEGGHVQRWEELSKVDDGVFCSRIEYRDLEDFCERAPAWINRKDAERSEINDTEHEFKRDFLGQRTAPTNAFFDGKDITKAITVYELPKDRSDITQLLHGRAFVVGGGLDMAKILTPRVNLKTKDSTVWSAVAKTASPETGEHEYWIVNQTRFPHETEMNDIKEVIYNDFKRFKTVENALELYGAGDLWNWCAKNGIHADDANPSTRNQYMMFAELLRIFREGRIHFPPELVHLESELRGFAYTVHGRTIEYGALGKGHDDCVYSLAWAVYSLFQHNIAVYELPSIPCFYNGRYAELCYLRGGGSILPPCNTPCEAHNTVKRYWNEYNTMRPYDDLSIQDFYRTKVRLKGWESQPFL